MIAERLRMLRKGMGATKRELVAKIPINYSTYANYESGFREPNSEVLQILATHFGVSLDYLLGMSDNPKKADEVAILNEDEHNHIISYRRLDGHGREMVDLVLRKEEERVIAGSAAQGVVNPSDGRWVVLQVYQQRASAGLGNYLGDYSDSDFETIHFEPNAISSKADFGVRLTGDSMEPKYKDNDIVYVRSTPHLDSGQVGIFIYGGEAYCKKLKIDRRKGRIFLESFNVRYVPKLISQPNQLRTVGLVLGVAIAI